MQFATITSQINLIRSASPWWLRLPTILVESFELRNTCVVFFAPKLKCRILACVCPRIKVRYGTVPWCFVHIDLRKTPNCGTSDYSLSTTRVGAPTADNFCSFTLHLHSSLLLGETLVEAPHLVILQKSRIVWSFLCRTWTTHHALLDHPRYIGGHKKFKLENQKMPAKYCPRWNFNPYLLGCPRW